MAASDRFNLRVITPDRREISIQAYAVVLPGKLGEFGVLPGHAPFFSTLEVGAMRVTEEPGGKTEWMAISGGFAEVKPGAEAGGNEVIILAPSAERAEEIDVNRAEAARQRADERLAAARAAEIDVARAEVALARALNRLSVAKRIQP